MSLVIRNARIRTNNETVDIFIEGEGIKAIAPQLGDTGLPKIDAKGSLVLPACSICTFMQTSVCLGR